MVNGLQLINAAAVIPDQLLDYVKAVSGLDSKMAGKCVLHHGGGQAVLVAYPPDNPRNKTAIAEAVEAALAMPGLEHITVMAPGRPGNAPSHAQSQTDNYWFVHLPLAQPRGKLANMLKRAERDVGIKIGQGAEAWTREHEKLAQDFCERKNLDENTRYIFRRLGNYLANAPEARLFSAFDPAGELSALAIADYASLATAFYMFACRRPNAAPGTADLLLYRIIREAEERGHSRVNLGLGIDSGVEFFKRKWQAEKWLPLVETSWDIRQPQKPRKGFLAKLFGK